MIKLKGRCSSFGGANDLGMKDDEHLAFYWLHSQCDERPDLFYPKGVEEGTSKRLRPDAFYCAIRFPVEQKKDYFGSHFKIINPATLLSVIAELVDWGPHERTGRVVDLSPGIMEALDIDTDDVVEVIEV